MKKILPAQNDQRDCHCIHRERVAAAQEHALPQRENEQLAALFKAMGAPNRLRILRALDLEEMCFCGESSITTIAAGE